MSSKFFSLVWTEMQNYSKPLNLLKMEPLLSADIFMYKPSEFYI